MTVAGLRCHSAENGQTTGTHSQVPQTGCNRRAPTVCCHCTKFTDKGSYLRGQERASGGLGAGVTYVGSAGASPNRVTVP